MSRENVPLKRLRGVDLGRSEEKRAYNRALFQVVAPAYQRVTRFLSFGQDRKWKEMLVEGLPEALGPVCLDLACGTGDIAARLAAQYPASRVIGIDLNREMLAVGQGLKGAGNQVMLSLGAGVAMRPVDVATSVQDATGAVLRAINAGARR